MIYLEAHDGHIVIPECPRLAYEGAGYHHDIPHNLCDRPGGCNGSNLALAEGDHVGIVMPVVLSSLPVRYRHRFVGVGIVGELRTVGRSLDPDGPVPAMLEAHDDLTLRSTVAPIRMTKIRHGLDDGTPHIFHSTTDLSRNEEWLRCDGHGEINLIPRPGAVGTLDGTDFSVTI